MLRPRSVDLRATVSATPLLAFMEIVCTKLSLSIDCDNRRSVQLMNADCDGLLSLAGGDGTRKESKEIRMCDDLHPYFLAVFSVFSVSHSLPYWTTECAASHQQIFKYQNQGP